MDSSVQPTPGFLPGATFGPQAPAPVTSPLGQGAPGQPSDQMQQLLKMILSGAQQRPQMAQPTPAPIPPGAPNQPALVGKHTGPANLGNFIGSTIQNAVHQDKQKKLAAATSDWTDLLTSTQKYMKPDGTIDPKAYQDPAVMQVLGDPKKLKRMAKALNQDWLNPKPDEYADAMKIAVKQHSDKQGAMQGLKQTMQQMVQHIRNQPQQQPTVGPEGAQKIMQRAPVSAPPPEDIKSIMPVVTELMKQQGEETKEAATEKRQQEKEQYDAYREDFKAKQSQVLETMRENSRQTFERMRETAAAANEDKRLAVMMKGMNMREADQFAIKPSEINKEVSSTLTDLRSQYTQANQQLKQLQAAAQKRGSSLWQKMISDEPDVSGAQWQVSQLQKAMNHIESNRKSIVTGKADMDSVVNEAMQIMNAPPPPSGFVPDK